MQARCSISSTSASRSLPSLDPPRHTCRWTSPCTATAGRGCWLQKLMFGESYFMRLDELHTTVQQRVDDLQK
eukprot:scaffold721_cov78-Phaeocystis_antarctica.AAC.1